MTLITNHTIDDPVVAVELIESVLALAEVLRSLNLESEPAKLALARLARNSDFCHLCDKAEATLEASEREKKSHQRAALAADHKNGSGNGDTPVHILPPYQESY